MRPPSRGRRAIRMRRLLLNRSLSQLAESLQTPLPIRSQKQRRGVLSMLTAKWPLNRIARALVYLVAAVSSEESSATVTSRSFPDPSQDRLRQHLIAHRGHTSQHDWRLSEFANGFANEPRSTVRHRAPRAGIIE